MTEKTEGIDPDMNAADNIPTEITPEYLDIEAAKSGSKGTNDSSVKPQGEFTRSGTCDIFMSRERILLI